MAKIFPVFARLAIYITDGDMVGSVSYAGAFGKAIDEKDMAVIIADVLPQLPPGFRLMNYEEAMKFFAKEEKGIDLSGFALPRLDEGDEWHQPEEKEDADGKH